MGFGERVCVIVACDVLVRIVVVVGDTIFRFPRSLDVIVLVLYLCVVLLFVVWRVYWYWFLFSK